MIRNPFESLCRLGGKEKWCWKTGCTTCGCMHFRAGFRAIIQGLDPIAEDWPIHNDRPVPDAYFNRTHPWPPAEQGIMAGIAAPADLSWIARCVPFPDWLGHVGLLLFFTQECEQQAGILTRRFAPQLAGMCEEPLQGRLMGLVGADRRLTPGYLEFVEQDFNLRGLTRPALDRAGRT